ncbi:hypothetical protein HK102_002153 [Quaeritorhiza haematococci]|nr:hypothetical protein HK102_002153 [Quaeritorhiza haematococci]
MTQNLTTWIKDFDQMKERVQVTFCIGDALSTMDELTRDKKKFDVIDSSNLVDHLGMFNLLVSGSILLKHPNESYLKTCSFRLHAVASSREEYLDVVTGLPIESAGIPSLHVREVDRGLEISCYFPGLVGDWNPSEVTVTLHLKKLNKVMMPLVLPCASPVKFSQMKYTRCPQNALREMIQWVLEEPCLPTTTNVTASAIHEKAEGFSVKVPLSAENKKAKISLSEDPRRGTFLGLSMDRQVVKIDLPCEVEVQSCKIHRWSGFVMLNMKKKLSPPRFPLISFQGLRTLREITGVPLGIMYTGRFADVKSGSKPLSSLPKPERLLYQLKETVQNLFLTAVDHHHPGLLIETESPLTLVVLFHGLYGHPGVDTAHAPETPFFDASYAFMESEKIAREAWRHLLPATDVPWIKIDNREEVEALKRLFDRFHETFLEKAQHATIAGTRYGDGFKRCVIHPLYAASIDLPEDPAMAQIRNLQRKGMNMANSFKRSGKSGDERLDQVLTNLGGRDMPAFQEEMLSMLLGMMGKANIK